MGKLLLTEWNQCILTAFYDGTRILTLNLSPLEDKQILNNIYVARVDRIVKNLNAAFLRYGEQERAYCALDHPMTPIFQNQKKKRPGSSGTGVKLQEGDIVLAQISQEAIKTKEPCARTELSFAGRYVVLEMNAPKFLNFSKKIRSREFRRGWEEIFEHPVFYQNETQEANHVWPSSVLWESVSDEESTDNREAVPDETTTVIRKAVSDEEATDNREAVPDEATADNREAVLDEEAADNREAVPDETTADNREAVCDKTTEDSGRESSEVTSLANQLACGLRGLPPCGFILRTNALSASEEDILKEMIYLASVFRNIAEKGRYRSLYSLIYRDIPGYLREVRDAYETQVDEVVTDVPSLYEQMKESFAIYPDLAGKLRLYRDGLLPLSKLYPVEKTMREALGKKVWLKSGGYLIIEQTEACVVIDVNTGKFDVKKEKEAAFLKINLEAAEEIAVQLRLRNLSGMILVDFINMQDPENDEMLLQRLKACAAQDPNPVMVVDMTKLKLVELTRKKERKPLAQQCAELFI